MNPTALGTRLGEIVLGTVREQRNEMHELVKQDPQVTDLNYIALLFWVAMRKISLCLSLEETPIVSDAMLEAVLSGCKGDPTSMHKVLHDRIRGYDTAEADGSGGERLHNIAKYFLACCGSRRASIGYSEIIPDPEDLGQIEEFVNAAALEQLRQARNREGCPTYPMDARQTMQVAAHIAGFGGALGEVLEHVGG